MRRFKLTVTVAAACLLAVTLAIFTVSAQVGEESACATACHEAKARCVTSCGSHSNPVECDARCQEEAQDCLERCEES